MKRAARIRLWVSALPLALLAIVLGLYARTAWNEFIDYDTSIYLTSNPHVLGGLSAENVRWAFTNFDAANWHPLTWISHMLDVDLFGLEPAGQHLESAAWHALNTLLAWALFLRLGLARGSAFAGALLFAVHPLRVESVAWIVERKDLLFACFGLATIVLWLDWRRGGGGWRLAAALVCYACSLMSKAMLVTLPCLLALLEFWPLGRERLRLRRSDLALAGFAVLALAFCVLTVSAQRSFGAVQDLETWPLVLRIENALDGYRWYVQTSFWPADLAFHYPLALHPPRIGLMLLDAALLGSSLWVAWALRRRLPGVLVGWLWFLGTLVPVIGLVQVGGQAHADRFAYFPCLGLLLCLLIAVERELVPRVGTRLPALAGSAAAALLAATSWRQIGYWHDSVSLTKHALEVTRANNVAHDVLGSHYSNAGQLDEALAQLREAVRIAPADPDAVTNLGVTLLRREEYAEAEKQLQLATQLVPGRAQTWSLLGYVEYKRGRLPESLASLDQALARDPQHLEAWTTRGLVLEAQGRLDEAVEALRHATGQRGYAWSAELTLGRVLLHLDRAEEARPHFELVLQHDPANFDALRGLERVELARGALARAWTLAQAAERVRSGSAPALADQAWILATAREGPLAQPAQALDLARRAVAAGGEQPALLEALAQALAANGDFAGAAAAAEKLPALVRGADPAWAARLERRLAAYRAGRIDRETPR